MVDWGDKPDQLVLILFISNTNIIMTKLNNKQKRSIRRQVDIDLGVNDPSTSIHKNKKKYNRNVKHKKKEDEKMD